VKRAIRTVTSPGGACNNMIPEWIANISKSTIHIFVEKAESTCTILIYTDLQYSSALPRCPGRPRQSLQRRVYDMKV
jgi:hypothetical protein